VGNFKKTINKIKIKKFKTIGDNFKIKGTQTWIVLTKTKLSQNQPKKILKKDNNNNNEECNK